MFSDTVSLISTIALVSDRDFYRDYGEVAGEYNRQLLESSVALSKRWQHYGLTGELQYVQDLDAPNNRATLQRLPTVTFTGVGEKLGATPFFFFLDSAATNFHRTEGVSGQRFDLHPKLALYRQAGIFDLALHAGYRERFYNAYGADAGSGSHATGMANAAATVSAPLVRIYDAQWGGVQRIRHLLLPEIGYRYGETKNQEQLPFFDYDDRPLGQSMAVWSLASYVTGKLQQADGPPQYRDLLYLKLSQGYQFSGSRRDLLTLVDEGRSLTDLRLESRVTPTSELSLALDSRFNTYQARFSTVSLVTDFADKAGNLAGIGYQYARGDVEYLEGRLGVALVKPFVFNYTSRYSFDRGNFLESRYALEYKRQCWSVILSYSDRPDNRQFMVNFTLAGIGALGPVKAF
jgi:LPS-assembly protein